MGKIRNRKKEITLMEFGKVGKHCELPGCH